MAEDKVMLYADNNFGGKSTTITGDQEDLRRFLKDGASSIKCGANNATQWTAYTEINYTGSSSILDKDGSYANVAAMGLPSVVKSIRKTV